MAQEGALEGAFFLTHRAKRCRNMATLGATHPMEAPPANAKKTLENKWF
jgi:hypothetical protein